MIKLEYDELNKWRQWLARLWKHPAKRKALIILAPIGLAVVVGAYLATDYLPYRTKNARLIGENDGLKKTAESQRDELAKVRQDSANELAKLRHENENLVSENNRLKIVINPIERRAKEIYPELETGAALAKLAKDLEDVRSLATRSMFRPATPDVINTALHWLSAVPNATSTVVTVQYEKGSVQRQKVADELVDILTRAGFKASNAGGLLTMLKGPEPNISVSARSNNLAQAESLLRAVTPFIHSTFVMVQNERLATNTLEIHLFGSPAFLPNGSVVFEQ